MRLNVYTEELQALSPIAEIVTAEYVSSRTGAKMKNYGLRIFLKSHTDLHFSKNDDDRSAVTFWCGEKESNVLEFWESIKNTVNG